MDKKRSRHGRTVRTSILQKAGSNGFVIIATTITRRITTTWVLSILRHGDLRIGFLAILRLDSSSNNNRRKRRRESRRLRLLVFMFPVLRGPRSLFDSISSSVRLHTITLHRRRSTVHFLRCIRRVDGLRGRLRRSTRCGWLRWICRWGSGRWRPTWGIHGRIMGERRIGTGMDVIWHSVSRRTVWTRLAFVRMGHKARRRRIEDRVVALGCILGNVYGWGDWNGPINQSIPRRDVKKLHTAESGTV